jgi:quinol monooxygenase YgiN
MTIPGTQGTNFYVYYKIAPERSNEVRSLVKALFAELEKQTGIRGRWMRRRDDPTTYMEVFEGVKDEAAFEALLDREGARLGLQRKVERFISAETPA